MFSYQDRYSTQSSQNSWAPIKKNQNRKPLANITNSTRNSSYPQAEKKSFTAYPPQECEAVDYQPEFDDIILDNDNQFFLPNDSNW